MNPLSAIEEKITKQHTERGTKQHAERVITLSKNIKELKDFAKTHRQKNRELNQELSRRDEGISSLKHKLSEHEKWNLLLPSLLKKYKIDDILNLAEKLKIIPDKLLELAYTPSDVIKILGLEEDNDINPHKVTELMKKYQLFQSPYAKRLYRLADSDRTEKYTSTVFFSILGVIEFYYWYERGKTLQRALKRTWEEHKEDFIYLSKR
ncbi:hypothetical protein COTS27_00282 [Spirochaetota bacterium]|nr:hypothetical protein COTS27_00282 [Spirochaetota bacterium]